MKGISAKIAIQLAAGDGNVLYVPTEAMKKWIAEIEKGEKAIAKAIRSLP
jgi:hypothetical protein